MNYRLLICIGVALVASIYAFAADSTEKPTFSIATDPSFAPMEFKDSSGQIVGFDIDLMQAAAYSGNFKVIFVSMDWDAIFRGLAFGDYDAIMSSITVTDERRKTMDFSIAYFQGTQVLVIRSESKDVVKISNLSGSTVGVIVGSVSEKEINKVSGTYRIQVKTYQNDILPAFTDLLQRKIDAFYCDTIFAENTVNSNDPELKNKIKIASIGLSSETYAVAVKKGNAFVLSTINNGLNKVIGSNEYLAIERKWFR